MRALTDQLCTGVCSCNRLCAVLCAVCVLCSDCDVARRARAGVHMHRAGADVGECGGVGARAGACVARAPDSACSGALTAVCARTVSVSVSV